MFSDRTLQRMAICAPDVPISNGTCPLLSAAHPPASATIYNNHIQKSKASNTCINASSTASETADPPTCALKPRDSLVIDNGCDQLTAFNAVSTFNNATCAAPFRKPVPATLALTTPLTCAATYTTTIPTAALATAAAASNSWRLLLLCAAALSAAEAVIAVLVVTLCRDLPNSSNDEQPKAGSEKPKAAAILQSAVSSSMQEVASVLPVVCGGWKQALSGSALKGLHMCYTFHQQQTKSTFTITSTTTSSSSSSSPVRRTKMMKIDETSSEAESASPASPANLAVAFSGESRRSGQLSPGALQGVAACLAFHQRQQQQQQSKWVSASSSASKSPKSHPIDVDDEYEDCEE
jgi:hypothetical protein